MVRVGSLKRGGSCNPRRYHQKKRKRGRYDQESENDLGEWHGCSLQLSGGGACKKGQRFRAGVEGRISVLFRGRGMKRCLAQGRTRFELLVGAAVLANNLMRIAALMIKSSSRKRPTA